MLQVWWSWFLLLLTTSPSTCLKKCRNQWNGNLAHLCRCGVEAFTAFHTRNAKSSGNCARRGREIQLFWPAVRCLFSRTRLVDRIYVKLCRIFFSTEFCFPTISETLIHFNLRNAGSHNQRKVFLPILMQILTLETARAEEISFAHLWAETPGGIFTGLSVLWFHMMRAGTHSTGRSHTLFVRLRSTRPTDVARIWICLDDNLCGFGRVRLRSAFLSDSEWTAGGEGGRGVISPTTKIKARWEIFCSRFPNQLLVLSYFKNWQFCSDFH